MGNFVVAGSAAVLLLLDRHRLPHTRTTFGDADTTTNSAPNSTTNTATNTTAAAEAKYTSPTKGRSFQLRS